MENIFVPPLALRGISVNGGSARHKDALRLGMPFHIDAAYFGQGFPCGRLPCFPFPAPFGVCEYSSFEPAFIQKRNERERHRVRCVNEGYARLREHLPQEFEDKRLSKVETLRAAIDYIKHLQGLLDADVSRMEMSFNEARDCEALRRRTECGSDGESKASMSDSGDNVY
ncbi:achaete-scute homolog 4 [Xiphophorus maculatus]|uniref:achaete-scute homolog 4 n=1 Tax=Xiphophorus maculatus TaxID=8083 RepID=UPI0003B50B86|nr:achaete-scute homolog 4 [Xiphophorus maculatus]XP_027900163.1 achaete-scute homolog 4-like [Xiphophorus couchianus]